MLFSSFIGSGKIRVCSLLWLLYAAPVLRAQELPLKISTGAKSGCITMESRDGRFIFNGEIDHFQIKRDKGMKGFFCLEIPGFFKAGDLGGPELPMATQLFEANADEIPELSIIGMDSIIYNLSDLGVSERLQLSKPSVRKGDSLGMYPADTAAYGCDAWLGLPLISIDFEGVMRGVPVSNFKFSPFKYNPVSHQLKIYHHLTCSIKTSGAGYRNHIPTEAFSGILKRVIRDESLSQKKGLSSEEPMTLVILSDTLFRETLLPFVEWKTRKGFRVVEAYRQDPEVGSNRESILSYLNGLYKHPPDGIAPTTYLLIVGDVQFIPLSQSGGQITDLYYAEYDGDGDYLPDVFYGRISVDSIQQLQAVINKILEYEQFLFTDPSFLGESVLIAGMDDAFAAEYGNGQIDYAQRYYLNSANGNNARTFLYPESGENRHEILDLISDGVGFVNYTGHGEFDRWRDPAFLIRDIDSLKNLGKYPVMLGNGCETNIFSVNECFAEALLRAPGKGALAYIGCTNDSYWDEDYYWTVGVGPVSSQPSYEDSSPGFYDKVFHRHGEPFSIWTPSLGEMVFGGNMAVQQSNSSRKKFYWEIYQLAGDPSLHPWFSPPGAGPVIYPELLPPGASRVDITCEPNAYAALSQNGILYDAKHASSEGSVMLSLPDTLTSGTIELLISGTGHRTFTSEIVIGEPEDAYLDLLEYSLTGESVEEDMLVTYQEQFSIALLMINRGATALVDDTLVLNSFHPDLEILDSIFVLDFLEAGETIDLQSVFRISTGHLAEDQSRLVLGLKRQGDQGERIIYMEEKIHAPVLASGGIRWNDHSLGDGDGIAEAGEWLECNWLIYNTGHYRTVEISGSGHISDSSLFSEVYFDTVPVLQVGDSIRILFRARVSNTESGFYRSGSFTCGDAHVSVSDKLNLSPGRFMEDFSTAGLERFPFTDSASMPWYIDAGSFVSSPFSLRSGKIGNLGKSELSIWFNTVTADTLSFSCRVSSEADYDFLRFIVDSTLVESWSGETGWQNYSYALDQGVHKVSWSYQKDELYAGGDDAAWIDDIIFPKTAFRQADLSLLEIIAPESGPWLSENEQLCFLVRNSGMDTIHGFTLSVSVNQGQLYHITIDAPLPPWKNTSHCFEEIFDLSELGEYHFNAWISSNEDLHSDNDSIETFVEHYSYPDLSLSLSHVDHMDGVHADAHIGLENLGNTTLDTLFFQIRIEDTITGEGYRALQLDPGQMVQKIIRLVDSSSLQLPTGEYEFLIRSLETDSVPANNEISGVIYWQALGMEPGISPNSILLYPNPGSKGFHLLFSNPVTGSQFMEIIGLNGVTRGIYSLERGSNHTFIKHTLSKGHYLIRIQGMGITLPLVISE